MENGNQAPNVRKTRGCWPQAKVGKIVSSVLFWTSFLLVTAGIGYVVIRFSMSSGPISTEADNTTFVTSDYGTNTSDRPEMPLNFSMDDTTPFLNLSQDDSKQILNLPSQDVSKKLVIIPQDVSKRFLYDSSTPTLDEDIEDLESSDDSSSSSEEDDGRWS
ncbi:uncharacterized protein LOC125178187 [Hyalella azteca]|uniref:Uncharacterized protein LOC125178187 n=1 Tax=Hyalella azteca TaxID=294128 RepID=A0A979FKV8_HYAAZ|nr:uncharacterized protein LOC125178187 [Hyalella azteca]